MSISLERLIEGIIATMRTDVIPNVSDAYARGQAVGVIDLLNNIAARVEWSRKPIEVAVVEKLDALRRVGELVPELGHHGAAFVLDPAASTLELTAMRDRLDGAICDTLAALLQRRRHGIDAASAEAIDLLVDSLRQELKREMKLTRKPLFAEIASGAAADRDTRGSVENGRGG